MPNGLGLSDMLIDNLAPQVVTQSFDDSCFQLITSGRRVDNPAELFGSARLLEVLAQLREQFDMVIFDGPPLLVNEALVLASRLESVLLVIQPGRTREEVARMIMKQLRRAKANLIGVVLNRVPKSQAYASAGYFYYDDDDEERGKNRKQAEQERVQAPSDPEEPQTSPIDQTQLQPHPPTSVLGPYKERIDQLLKEREEQPQKQPYTVRRIYELIQGEGYSGSQRTVRSYVG